MLLITALLAALGEALDTVSAGWPGIVMAALFVLGAVLIRRGGRGGVVLVGVLMLSEVVFLPFYERESAADWLIQTSFLVLGPVGLSAAIATLLASSSGMFLRARESG